MSDIVNPTFSLKENNIFTIREKDYQRLLPLAREIIEPVTEIGFQIIDIDLKNQKFSSGELFKTFKQTLSIKLQKKTSTLDLTLEIPKLIDKNYIVINGRKKVPLFQLFDIPIVTRGKNIKIRTNVATIMITKEKEQPFIHMSFLKKKVPLALVMLANYGCEELNQRFDLDNYETPDNPTFFEQLITDLQFYYVESKDFTQDDFLLELGRFYSKYNIRTKGEDVLYALDLLPKVDPFTREFMTKETLLEEIVFALTQDLDDTLFTNKRIRCFEYIVYSKLSKLIFDLCIANRTARQPKFSINSTQILSECNVSEIVQFDFSINPIEELTKLSRVSLLGPGGFKRENIPKHLRDISPSMFGRVCPVDTPDRDNCGVLQNLVPNVKLDENMRFSEEFLENQPISIPVSMVPFLEHNDQTRLQMASSQMRQAVMLRDFEVPLVRSGCEHLYTDQTQFVKKAKKDGEVIYVNKDYIIVVYNDGEADILDIKYRKIYIEHMDFMNVYVKVGDKFKAGDILAESNFCKDGKIVFGRNLLTGVAIYYGNNYEDGIVISDRLVDEDCLTSVHYGDLSFVVPPDKVLLSLKEGEYKPLPEELETIECGQPYAIMKSMVTENPYSVFSEPLRYEVDRRTIISELKIYPNTWNEEIPEYKDWIEKQIAKQQEQEASLKTIIEERFSPEKAKEIVRQKQLTMSSFVGKFKQKREKINGVLVNMYGIHFRQVKVGDKLANRHGNKGVIARIVPQNKMPMLEDGRHLDICINPLGIISRMNIGQIFELHLSMALQDLKEQLLDMYNKKKSNQEIRDHLLNFIKIIDKTKDNWYYNQFVDLLPEVITPDFIKDLTIIQAPFESCKLEDVRKALEYTNTRFTYKVYDPVAKKYLENEIAVGYVYFLRMVHIAEEKLAARGIGTYAKRTLQPLGGRRNLGGQRAGEMEVACLIGHDAAANLFEFLTTKSDCIDLKNKYIKSFISETETLGDTDIVPESVKLLNAYLTVIGVKQ